MPSRQSADPPRRPRLRKSREEVERLLQEQIKLGEELFQRINPGAYVPGVLSELEADYDGWTDYAKELLRTLFDTEEVADEFNPQYLRRIGGPLHERDAGVDASAGARSSAVSAAPRDR